MLQHPPYLSFGTSYAITGANETSIVARVKPLAGDLLYLCTTYFLWRGARPSTTKRINLNRNYET